MKEGKLVVCATPIGNLEDASPRLARALAEADLAAEPRTMVFFEAPHRVLATLDAMAAAFGPDRAAAAVRELTKVHEQVLRGPLAEVRERLADQGPRGELTLVVGGLPPGAARPAARPADLA